MRDENFGLRSSEFGFENETHIVANAVEELCGFAAFRAVRLSLTGSAVLF
jgi:hypothetical protein